MKFYDIEKLSIVLLTPAPVDIVKGLAVEEEFFNLDKVSKDIAYKVGIGGEVQINQLQNDIHSLQLIYLPNAPAIYQIGALRKAKTEFGIMIQNKSSPNYKGAASKCRIEEKPSVMIGRNGLKNRTYKIILFDFLDIDLPETD